jgi:hypothetical protein
MQEYGTVGEFTWMFVFELGTQLLKYLWVIVCVGCVIAWFQVQKGRVCSVVEKSHHLNFFSWTEVECQAHSNSSPLVTNRPIWPNRKALTSVNCAMKIAHALKARYVIENTVRKDSTFVLLETGKYSKTLFKMFLKIPRKSDFLSRKCLKSVGPKSSVSLIFLWTYYICMLNLCNLLLS